MFELILPGLITAWILWCLPFLLHYGRTPAHKADVTVSTANWGILLQGLGCFIGWFHFPGPRPGARLIAALLLAALGVVTAWWAVPALGKQLRVRAGLYSDHELVRTGPYRIVRHPIYASLLAMYLATALVMSSWPALLAGLVLMIAGTEIRVRVEDRLLASRFGGHFAAYQKQAPAYLPFVR
jgi:protein-S-isoprenylcysteine O-methyltransferase Ste14